MTVKSMTLFSPSSEESLQRSFDIALLSLLMGGPPEKTNIALKKIEEILSYVSQFQLYKD